jgi:tripartite-type tricarboxylate transporter receptor subunit TctC
LTQRRAGAPQGKEKMSKSALFMLFCAAGSAFCLQSARAETIESFYRGKTVTLVASTGVGGVFDLTARTVAKYMPKYIPGKPVMIVKNMPGGGHVLATNFMASQAAKDGTFVALVNNGMPLHQVLDGRGVRYDALKFNWLGSAGLSNLMTVAWHTSGVKTVDDVMTHELITAATGTGSNGFIYPNAMNVVLGTKFKIVLGYKTSPEADLAMERGEAAARAGFSLSAIRQEHPDWITDKKVAVLVQVGAEREKDFADVPLMHELAKTPEQRRILALISSPVSLGRPFFTTPDTPAERVAALREAFAATMADADFLAEARQLNLDIKPMGGAGVTRIVDETINVPAELIAKAKVVLEVPAGGPGAELIK